MRFGFGSIVAAVCIAVSAALPAWAQTPELTERFDGNGWTVGYPAGWLVLEEMPLLLGNAEGMLATVQRGADPPEGGIAIGFFPAAVLESLGITPGNSAVDLAFAMSEQFNGDLGDLTPLNGWALPAFAISVSVPADGETFAIGAKTPTGDLIGLIVNAVDIEAALAIAEVIVASYAPAAG